MAQLQKSDQNAETSAHDAEAYRQQQSGRTRHTTNVRYRTPPVPASQKIAQITMGISGMFCVYAASLYFGDSGYLQALFGVFGLLGLSGFFNRSVFVIDSKKNIFITVGLGAFIAGLVAVTGIKWASIQSFIRQMFAMGDSHLYFGLAFANIASKMKRV